MKRILPYFIICLSCLGNICAAEREDEQSDLALSVPVLSKQAPQENQEKPIDLEEQNILGLTAEQERVQVEAIIAYMNDLNHTCRYEDPSETSSQLPPAFFTLMPERRVFLREGIKVSDALASLREPPALGEKHVIDCSVAAATTELYSIRCVINDDSVFELLCRFFLFKHSRELTVTSETVHHYTGVIHKKLKRPVPGCSTYFQQLNDPKDFFYQVPDDLKAFTKKNGLTTLQQLQEMMQHRPGTSPYHMKHNFLMMQGVNTFCVEPNLCVFFEGSEGFAPLTFQATADMLVQSMDADMTPEEVILQKLRPEASRLFNAIKYRDAAEASRTIVKRASYAGIDFSTILQEAVKIRQLQEKVAALKREASDKKEFKNS